MQQLLDAMPGVAAVIQNGRLDILAANQLGRALYSDKFDGVGSDGLDAQGRLPNHARYTFLDPRAADFYADWAEAALTGVSLLRAEAGRNPEDPALNELIGELASRSVHFTRLWAAHDVRIHTSGTKHFHHRVAGDLTLNYETLQLPGDPGQSLLAYTAEPATPSSDAFAFLASWATSTAQSDDTSTGARP